MTTAKWTTIIEDPNAVIEPTRVEKWTSAGPRVLEVLTDWTICGCAILRAEATNAQNMVLEGYKFSPNLESSVGFSIPQTKSLRFWNGNAFASCCVQHYPNGSLEAAHGRERESFTAEEAAFLSQVYWRGSFPLSVDSLGHRMAIIVALERNQPKWISRDQMALAWFAAQLTASLGIADSFPLALADPYIQACRFIPALCHLGHVEQQLAAVLRILCSGRGLGWQRVWLLKREGDSYECQTAAGGLTMEDWGEGAHFAASSFEDLTDEIAHDIIDNPRQDDGMYRACVATGPLSVGYNLFSNEASINGDALFVVPAEMTSDERDTWKAKVTAHCQGVRFEDDERIFYCPFRLGGSEYLAVLTWSNVRTGESPTRIVETGVILATISEMIGEQGVAFASPAQADQDFAMPSVGSLRFTNDVIKILAWLNVVPTSREELELAKIKRRRMRFENSPDYRNSMSDQMLAARTKRHAQIDVAVPPTLTE